MMSIKEATFPCGGCGREFIDRGLFEVQDEIRCEFCSEYRYCKDCLAKPCGHCKELQDELKNDSYV
jgi:cytidine deaminase